MIIFYYILAFTCFTLFVFWVIKKLNLNPQNKSIFNIIAFILSAVLFRVLFIIYVFFMITYTPSRKFSASSWKNSVEHRFEMGANIIEKNILIGLDSNEVKLLLGEPIGRDFKSNSWNYNMGFGGGGLGFLDHYLFIEFNNNKVVKVKHHEVKS